MVFPFCVRQCLLKKKMPYFFYTKIPTYLVIARFCKTATNKYAATDMKKKKEIFFTFLNSDWWPDFFIHYVKAMFVTEQSPNDGHILNEDVEWDCRESTTDAHEETQHPKAVE